jgi:hypothetical protein
VEIEVTDVNEPPVFQDPLEFTIDDPDQPDQFSDTVVATDPEEVGVNFSIVGGNDPDDNETDAFTINPDSGEITVANAPELEGRDVFNLEVQATDTSEEQLSNTAEVTINVGPAFDLDVDDDGSVNSLTDGLIIFRHIATDGDFSSYEDNLGDEAQLSPQQIAENLNEVDSGPEAILDVDNDESVNSLTDGLIIFRHIATDGDVSSYENNLGDEAQLSAEQIGTFLDTLTL